ncbi:4'-phosphopantetheinyl transferase superfamily protein [Pseudomonas sp. ABC1]|uniref:4'-phosphopantetheinyl transferase family protein n=1 Tax=Pseudomonas sp. ABC1 TaxID=2748080 RepID=UPI0015C3D0D6|nr:4'-phosphopantetheinyl transferase superfamily protein [Pseudomonas sp. ABC1]QLF93905.1 4'-phosphopantetheinyl transferase superfamily protein [Pseudomonas sp. ABC1]
MNTPPIPPFCSMLETHWPLPFHLPGISLVSARFDAKQLQDEDFESWGLPRPEGIRKRQAEFFAGRICAFMALMNATGCGHLPTANEDRSPCWPPSSIGSITHSHGHATAVAAQSRHWRGLGVDSEQLIKAERANRLAEQILTQSELDRYSDLPQAVYARHLTLAFSLKESLFKALYPLVGQPFYFHDAALSWVGEDGHATLKLLRDLSTEWRAGSELQGQFTVEESQVLTLVSIPH